MNSCNYRLGKAPNVRDKKPQKFNNLVFDKQTERYRKMERVMKFKLRNDRFFFDSYWSYSQCRFFG